MQARAILLILIGVCIAVAVFPRRAPAQPRAAANADTTAVFGFLRPTYTTSYDINRSQTTWTQSFSFKNKINQLNFGNSTDYTVKTDPNRVNFRAKSGKTGSSMEFTALSVPVTADLTYQRTTTDDTNLQTRQDLLDSGLNASYNLRLFRGARTNLNAGVGATRRKDQNIYSGKPTGAVESGLTQDFKVSSNYNGPFPGMIFRLDNQLSTARTSPKSIGTEQAVAGAGGAGPRTNSRLANNFTWTWTPFENAGASVNWAQTRGTDHYIIVSRDTTLANRVELAQDKNTQLSMNLNYKPTGGKREFNLDYHNSKVKNTRAIEKERARDSGSSSVEVRMKQSLMGNIVNAHMENTNDEELSEVLPSSKTLTRVVDGSVERQYPSGINVKLLGEMRLRSQTYVDGRQDKDSLKKRLEANFSSRPLPRLLANLAGRWSNESTLLIHPSQSKSTRLEENFGVTADLSFSVTNRTTITQRYSFQALFTSFRFDAPQDNLQRTRDIGTTLTHQLSKTVTLSLKHAYQFRETGGYRKAGGVRYFAKGNVRYLQDLTSSVVYKPLDWLSFQTDERLYRTDDIRVVNGARTPNSRTELTQHATFERPIPGGGSFKIDSSLLLQMQLRPVKGKTDHFFAANLSLNKPF